MEPIEVVMTASGRPSQRFFYQKLDITKGELAILLSGFGVNREIISQTIGIAKREYERAIREWPEFGDRVMAARREADVMVVNALFKRAVGYNVVETIVEQGGRIVKQHYKHIAPDVAACIFWLKNRMKDEWSDNYKAELTLRDRMELGNRQLTKGD
jgi:hypothetical protein